MSGGRRGCLRYNSAYESHTEGLRYARLPPLVDRCGLGLVHEWPCPLEAPEPQSQQPRHLAALSILKGGSIAPV